MPTPRKDDEEEEEEEEPITLDIHDVFLGVMIEPAQEGEE